MCGDPHNYTNRNLSAEISNETNINQHLLNSIASEYLYNGPVTREE